MVKAVKMAVKPAATIFFTLLIGALMIINAGESPIEAYGALFIGAFGSVNGILNTLARATPLIFTGLAASLAAIAGVFNIGIEGQLYFGALAAALVGSSFTGLPGIVLIPLCLTAAMAAAAVWGLIPGILNNKLKINIFIMFFMMNNMAQLFTDYLVNNPFKGDLPEAATNKVVKSARLYRFSVFSDLSVGILLAVMIALVLWFILKRTKIGYRWYALGLNRTFSEYIGIHAGRNALIVLCISSMISGLAGAEQVMGNLGRFYANFSNGLGFTGISIGLLASNNPISVIIFSVFFGALSNGSIQMAVGTGVPSELIDVLQSMMILMVSADFAITMYRKEKKQKGGSRA